MRSGSPVDSGLREARNIGISTGVVDPRRTRGGLDGIGTYTEALLAHVERLGLTTKRVDTPHISGRGLTLPSHADIRLAIPLPISVALGALAHRSVGKSDRKDDKQNADTDTDNADNRPRRTVEHI